MKVERIKVEVEFCEIECFEPFEYKGQIYLRLPALTCTVQQYYGHAQFRSVKGDFNAVEMTNSELGDYEYFERDKLVRPLKAELKIYE